MTLRYNYKWRHQVHNKLSGTIVKRQVPKVFITLRNSYTIYWVKFQVTFKLSNKHSSLIALNKKYENYLDDYKRTYCLPPLSEREKVRAIVTELLNNNIIQESTSPYASLVILLRKKDASIDGCKWQIVCGLCFRFIFANTYLTVFATKNSMYNRPVTNRYNLQLVVFDPKRETELHTDASSLEFGAILFQRHNLDLRVVSYYSKWASLEDSKYHSYELDTLEIVNALKHFLCVFIGNRIQIDYRL